MLPGLEPGRGNILLAGLEIYQEILATIGVDGMIISDSGLLEGIMLSCLTPGPGRFNLIL
jgi:exopolyphosphatase/pppGpp-phosphohydrolase